MSGPTKKTETPSANTTTDGEIVKCEWCGPGECFCTQTETDIGEMFTNSYLFEDEEFEDDDRPY